MKCSNIPNIYLTEITETFLSRGITDTWVLGHFELKICKDLPNSQKPDKKISNLSSLYVLNCFKYSDVTDVPKK